jgi:hypothetical protein
MKKIIKITTLFLVCVILIKFKVIAQCGFSATATSTESRCKESGSITIVPSSPDNYTYQIISGPSTSGISSTPEFYNLASGNYIVAVNLNGCTIQVNVLVSGNYIEPGTLTATVNNIYCPQDLGCININQPLNGRLPYTYSIVAGPVTRPNQSSNTFCNLPAGDYAIQSLDSCGVIRTSQYSVAIDTGDLYAYTLGYNISYANCNDIVVCAYAGFNNTYFNQRPIKVWYITPSGDTLKVNNFEFPVSCDTLVGQGHAYGNWKIVAFDSCGRIRQSAFTFSLPGINYQVNNNVCNGYSVSMGNSWKYSLQVGYRIRKCSDSSIVYDTLITPPTQFYSPYFDIAYDSCYILEHYNSCGDTVRGTISRAKPLFNINARSGVGCKTNGKGSIMLFPDYLSGRLPITYTIISGPEGVGNTVIQNIGASYVYMRDLTLGTYTVVGTDACGIKDTVDVTLNNPLQQTIELTQQKSCSGGANLHVKITSNFKSTAYPNGGAQYVTHVTSTSPHVVPVNIVATPPTATTPSVWEADYMGLSSGSFLIKTFASDGCNFDTSITINGYDLPVLSNLTGYACSDGTGTVNYTLDGGKNPLQFRIKPSNSSTWGAFQTNTTFSGITNGLYDLEVQDDCPNGSITSFAFTEWQKTPIVPNLYCTPIGETALLTTNPIIEGVTYEWFKNGTMLGTGDTLTIANYQSSDNGTYWLKQTFPGGNCVDSSALVYLDCSVLNNNGSNLYGQKIGTTSQLNWQANASDKGTLYKIERSMDGINFKIVGQVAAVDNASGYSYSFIDKNALVVNYYRLKMESINGKTSYSNSIRIDHKKFDVSIKVSPNPFTDKLSVYIHAPVSAPGLIKIRSITGNTISSISENILKGSNVIVLNEKIRSLTGGMYLVEVYIGTEKHILKVIKN